MMSTAVRILTEDNVYNTARKIWDGFVIGQSGAIWGTVIEVNPDTGRNILVEKGKAVVDQLREFDRMENTIDCGKRRKKQTLPDSIGGYVAQKIFRFKREIVNEDIKWTIWRRQ